MVLKILNEEKGNNMNKLTQEEIEEIRKIMDTLDEMSNGELQSGVTAS